MSIDTLLHEERDIPCSDSFIQKANVSSDAVYQKASQDRLKFWEEQAHNLSWSKPWSTVLDWQKPFSKWFVEGELNASYNCLDVHLDGANRTKKALIWEGENGDKLSLTYEELHQKVCQVASRLKSEFNIQKHDRVTLYMPMIVELVIAVLACARIGAIHSVVFGGFSAQSIRDRVDDSQSKCIITANGGYRRGKLLKLKETVDQALSEPGHTVKNVLVVEHLKEINRDGWIENRDISYTDFIKNAPNNDEAEPMNSEDPLFILYTSGTTGKPKGIIHSTGGYMTHAKYSTKLVFDLKDDDIYWCTADVGWITGHTYLVYGPLSNGATVFMYEGAPDYPDKGRFWKLIEEYKVTIMYTAPTAIRAFMKWGVEYPQSYDLSSLRLLGTVGEPINPEAWMWYYETIGGSKCPIVDTWWQTETGGIIISTIPGLHQMKPGTAGLCLPGISASILEPNGDAIENEGGGLLSINEPWPSMLRGIWGDPKRYEDVYWNNFSTYYAGDGATRDKNGYIKVLGRVDDVLNVSGHRIGTMEVESALVECASVAEAAVVGMPDDIKGQSILAFVILKESATQTPDTEKELIQHVAETIGVIAKPKKIIVTPELPKTRSGKIMRRILKNLGEGTPVGDATTLANPEIVELLAEKMATTPTN